MRTTTKTTARTSPRARRAAIDKAATALADALRALHGGRWETTVDHRGRFALIRERLRSAT
jgi:hypothetical protein